VTWLIHMCDMTHSHVWHDSFTCVTWLIHMCSMTVEVEMSHVSDTCVMSHTHFDPSDTWISHWTHMNQSCHTYEWVMSRISSPSPEPDEVRRVMSVTQESCHTDISNHVRYESVMAHMWNKSCHTSPPSQRSPTRSDESCLSHASRVT